MNKNSLNNPHEHQVLTALTESKEDLKKHRYHTSLKKHLKEVTSLLFPAS